MGAWFNSRLSRAGAWLLLGLTTAWFFGRALFSDVNFAVRDASHFYYPLFRWTVAERWAGRLPLWCPYEGLGTPLLADATASLFYPGQLLLFLPFGFEFNFKLYIVAHVLLAAFGVYRLTRSWRASPPAATIAALGYAFGGSVLFQYCNVVFLVGAAWLPFAVQEVWLLLQGERAASALRAMLKLAVFLALMVLGGDPQIAYHVGIIAAVGLVTIRRPRVQPTSALLAAAIVAIGLSAVQVFPSVSRSGQTTRAVGDRPRTIYEAPRFASAEITRGLVGVPEPETHHANLYDFSLGPWRWLELLWPNVGGQALPTHRRWMSAIPAEGRLWTPSLYMGLLPALAGLTELFRRGNSRTRWLRRTLLLFAAGSLGWYGIGWLCRELGAGCGADTRTWFVGQPVGGVYWFFVTFLPGYVQFRYPAKLWMVVALCLACLSTRGIDRALRGGRSLLSFRLLGIVVASVAFAAIIAAAAPRLLAIPVAADDSLGPFYPHGSLRDVLLAFTSTILVAVAAWLLLRTRQSGWALALLTAVDLAAANGAQVILAPAEIWREREKLILPAADAAIPRFYRAPWDNWSPRSWMTASSPNRLAEIAAWERATGFGRLPLIDRSGSIRGYSTFRDADYECLLDLVEKHRELVPALGGEGSLVPALDNNEAALAEDTQRVGIQLPFPRAWFVAECVPISPLPRHAAAQVRLDHLKNIFLPGGALRDLRRSAVIEVIDGIVDGDPATPIRVVREEGNELVLDFPAESRGGFFVVNVMYDAAWTATVDFPQSSAPLQIERANRVMLGLTAPPGACCITLRYRPRSFLFGAWISGLTFAALVIVCCRSKR